MSLSTFVSSLPKHWATCPIYRKDVVTADGKMSSGKNPLGKAHHNKLTPSVSLHYLADEPEKYGAVGVFSGPRSGGVLIWDIDYNLGQLIKKYADDLNGPRVISPKENAAKYFFRLPESEWPHVSDISLTASQEGWEALWGRQAVVWGDYPGGGVYTPEGDFSALPEAPEWLVARMRLRKDEKNKGAAKKKKDLSDPFRFRPKEVRYEIVAQCLDQIPTQGRGSNDFWWSIGAMIHSADLGEEGLELWRDWSKKDEEFAELWEPGAHDHCAERWEAGFSGEGLGMGSLIRLADENDPNRERFAHNGLAAIVAEDEAKAARAGAFLGGKEMIEKAQKAQEEFDNPAILEQEFHLIAKQGGKNSSAEVVKMLDAHLSYERNGGNGPVDVDDLDDTAFEYLIPGLLPKPWTLLIHADGGTGKTAMCQTLAKHINKGISFNIHGGMVDVPAGKVLWLNGDQNERILKRQFKMIDAGRGIKVVGEFDMTWYDRFKKFQKEGKYDLVVIDSLDGCNDANPYEENKREFAYPIKRLARRNGVDFPACTIIIIHHNTKEGKFRGTSAIKAAVDETWNMRKVNLEELMGLCLPMNTRMVTVEKSRDDREGHKMVFSLMPDYTYKIGPVPETDHTVKMDTPNQHTLDVLGVMRKDRRPWSIAELVAHDTVGGKHRKRAIEYGMQRLEQQALVERCDVPAEKRGRGRPPVYYQATGTDVPGGFRSKQSTLLAPVESVLIQNDCTGTDLNKNAVFGKIGDSEKESSSTPADFKASQGDDDWNEDPVIRPNS